MIASGALSLITGILGVRAAKDATKVKPVFILSAISLAIVVIGLIGSAISGSFSVKGLLELVAPGLMFWCANNVKVVPAPNSNHKYDKIAPHSRKTDVFMAFVAAFSAREYLPEAVHLVFAAPVFYRS